MNIRYLKLVPCPSAESPPQWPRDPFQNGCCNRSVHFSLLKSNKQTIKAVAKYSSTQADNRLGRLRNKHCAFEPQYSPFSNLLSNFRPQTKCKSLSIATLSRRMGSTKYWCIPYQIKKIVLSHGFFPPSRNIKQSLRSLYTWEVQQKSVWAGNMKQKTLLIIGALCSLQYTIDSDPWISSIK